MCNVPSSIFFYLLMPLLALAFCGCSLVLERDFSSEIPHVTADNEDDGGSGVLELTSYEELKDALQLYIQDRMSMQTVRLTDYSGDVERDVQHVVRDDGDAARRLCRDEYCISELAHSLLL